jgi:hypothetical protein
MRERTEQSGAGRRFALVIVPVVIASAAVSTAVFAAGNGDGPLDWGQLEFYFLFGGSGVLAGLTAGWGAVRLGVVLPFSVFVATVTPIVAPWVLLVLVFLFGHGD